jgi:hypothetical protein
MRGSRWPGPDVMQEGGTGHTRRRAVGLSNHSRVDPANTEATHAADTKTDRRSNSDLHSSVTTSTVAWGVAGHPRPRSPECRMRSPPCPHPLPGQRGARPALSTPTASGRQPRRVHGSARQAARDGAWLPLRAPGLAVVSLALWRGQGVRRQLRLHPGRSVCDRASDRARADPGRPYGASTCMGAPTGSAALDGAGGSTVSGRWAFNTGVRHARFSQVAAVVLDEHGAPRTGGGGGLEWRLASSRPSAARPSTRGTALACAAPAVTTWSLRVGPHQDPRADPAAAARRRPARAGAARGIRRPTTSALLPGPAHTRHAHLSQRGGQNPLLQAPARRATTTLTLPMSVSGAAGGVEAGEEGIEAVFEPSVLVCAVEVVGDGGDGGDLLGW